MPTSVPQSEHVKIFDTTLRDGEQTPGVSFNTETKIAIAQSLADLNVDVIEAGFPGVKQDFNVVKAIAETIDGPVICALSRSEDADVDAAAEATEPAASKGGARIHVFKATSDLHMQVKNETEESVTAQAVAAVERAKSYTNDVEFSPEDATRSRFEFMMDVILRAVDAGATTINIPDTVGYTLPHEYHDLIATIKEEIDGRFGEGAVDLSTHGHDDMGLATANAIAAIEAGARQVEVTVSGLGERAGNTSMEQVVAVLHERYGDRYTTQINTSLLTAVAHDIAYRAGILLQPNIPIIGNNSFAHEAGIHQDKVRRDTKTYEHMEARDYGQVAGQMVVGKLSGAGGVQSRMLGIGINAGPSVAKEVSAEAKSFSDTEGRPLADSDIESITATITGEEITDYVFLEDVKPNEEGDTSTVTVQIIDDKGTEITETAKSNSGMVDAAVQAINTATDFQGDIEKWHGASQQQGSNASAGIFVVVNHNGHKIEAYAQGVDIFKASVAAYIKAINLAYRIGARASQ